MADREDSHRIALDLLRMARNPATGRIRHTRALDVALRAGLFAEMALSGLIVDEANAPVATPAEPTGDRIFDAIRDTVQARPHVAWMRWFHYVRGDRTALSTELVESGRWQPTGGWPATFVDTQPNQVLGLIAAVGQITRRERPPADSREAVLALLAICCGAAGDNPRPSAVRRELRPVLESIGQYTTRKIVVNAANVIRRNRRGFGLLH